MMQLIYNQRSIPKELWRYGFRSSAATGCGWIATHNALVLMGCCTDIPQLIRYYEWQLPLIHGNAGTSFWGPAVCFRNWGFPVETAIDLRKFDALAGRSDVCILFYRWRRGCRIGAHFVALHKTDTGFVGYNTYRNSTGPDAYGPSLEAFLRDRKYFGGFLIGIRKKEKSSEKEYTP